MNELQYKQLLDLLCEAYWEDDVLAYRWYANTKTILRQYADAEAVAYGFKNAFAAAAHKRDIKDATRKDLNEDAMHQLHRLHCSEVEALSRKVTQLMQPPKPPCLWERIGTALGFMP